MTPEISFHGANSGFQAAVINGPVHAEFRLPPGMSWNAYKAAPALIVPNPLLCCPSFTASHQQLSRREIAKRSLTSYQMRNRPRSADGCQRQTRQRTTGKRSSYGRPIRGVGFSTVETIQNGGHTLHHLFSYTEFPGAARQSYAPPFWKMCCNIARVMPRRGLHISSSTSTTHRSRTQRRWYVRYCASSRSSVSRSLQVSTPYSLRATAGSGSHRCTH